MQLWQRGMYAAPAQWQQELLDGFRVPADYGVDNCQCFSTTSDQPSVVVPQIDLQLTPQQLSQLQQLYCPLVPSDEGGADIYVNVRQHIANVL